MTTTYDPPETASGLLDEALGGRGRDVQARLVDKLSRADVRELACAIDEAVLFAVGSFAAHVADYGANREQRLRGLVEARKAVARRGASS